MKVAVGLRRVAAGKRTSGRCSAQIAYALKAEDKYLHKRAFTSHSRNGLTAFAVFLLSLFVKRQDKPASGVGCRSPPANLDFQKNSDWR